MLYIWWENKFNKIKGNVKNYFSFQNSKNNLIQFSKNYFSFQNTVSAKGETEKYISLKLDFQNFKNKNKNKKKLDFQNTKLYIIAKSI